MFADRASSVEGKDDVATVSSVVVEAVHWTWTQLVEMAVTVVAVAVENERVGACGPLHATERTVRAIVLA